MQLIQSLVLCTLFVLLSQAASAQLNYLPMGKIDRTFGDGGFIVAQSGFGYFWEANSIRVPGGKILFAETRQDFATGNLVIQLTRMSVDGQPDPSFGKGGTTTLSFGLNDQALGVAALPNGSVVVVGESSTSNAFSNDLLVFRLTSDGNLDASFGNNGVFVRDLGEPNSSYYSDDLASAVLPLADGRMLIGGISIHYQPGENHGPESLVLLRLNANGTLDTSFGQNGILGTPLGESTGVAYTSEPVDLAKYEDNRFLVSFSIPTHTSDGYGQAGYIARYYNDGTLDAKFGEKGRFTCTFGYPYYLTLCENMKILPDGNILALMPFALTKIGPDGTLNPSFGNGGIRFFNPTILVDYSVQEDQRILVTGSDMENIPSPGTGSRRIGKVMRIHSNGMPDLYFGTLGKTRVSYSYPFDGPLPLSHYGDTFIGPIFRDDANHVLISGLYTGSSHVSALMTIRMTTSK